MFKTSNLSLPERLLDSHAMPTISGYHDRLMSGNNMPPRHHQSNMLVYLRGQ